MITFAASVLLTICYTLFWKRHDDLHITLVFVLVPISNLGNLLLARASSLEAALVANAVYYLGGCFLQLVIFLAICSMCRVSLSRWVRFALLAFSTAVYITSLTAGARDWFYSGVTFEKVNGVGTLRKQYGPLHSVFYGMIFVYFALGVGVIVYSYIRKKQISRKILWLLFLPDVVCMIAFFLGRQLFPEIELIPAAYVFAQIVYLRIAWRLNRYDVTGSVIESMASSGETGFIIFDRHFHYLGSNRTARKILPPLNDLTVDLSLNRSRSMSELLLPWLCQYRDHPEGEDANGHFYEKGDQIFQFQVGSLSRGKSSYGYRIVITDDTTDRKYISLLDQYNKDLHQQVDEKPSTSER